MVFEDDRPGVMIGDVALSYRQPDISVSTSARYTDIEVLGDVTVRQKMGSDPDTISINGICTEDEANQIDNLVHQDQVYVISSRWDGDAQVDSTNTDPLAEGGAMAEGEWTHTFTVDLTEDVSISNVSYDADPP